MLFAHDTESNLVAAVALVNTAGDPDTLTSLEELDAFFRTHGYSGWSTRKRSDLDDIRAVRGEVRRLLTATRDEAVAMVNLWLSEARATPRLVRHDDMDWHIHAVADTAPLASRIRIETAMAMIDVIRADEMSRLGVCADDDCDGIVLDLSRNRSRRFCSTACTNRAAVAAYRARQSR